MDIKIITTKFHGTGGDEISHYSARFEKNPTLEEFVQWILKERRNEWGYIEWYTDSHMFNSRLVEYRKGKVVSYYYGYEELKDKTIELVSMDGGWTRQDYLITPSRETRSPESSGSSHH